MVLKSKMARTRKVRLNRNARRKLRNARKNYRLLKTSWGVQTRVFFENSTLHGVRYIAESDRPFFERFIWFACVAVGAVATIVIIISLWEKFQTNPTITGLDTDFHNWDVPFPAVTLCQEVPISMDTINKFLENNTSYSSDYKQFLYDLSQVSFNKIPQFADKYSNSEIFGKQKNLKQLIYPLMNRCEDVLKNCFYKSDSIGCCDEFFPVFTEAGYCYVFNSRHYQKHSPGKETVYPEFHMHYIKETDLKWSLKFDVQTNETDMPIYILNSDEVAGIDVQPQHIWDYKVNTISFSVKQTYTTEETRQLSIKQRHCAFADEIKLDIHHEYTFTACTRQCRMDSSMRFCGCVPHFYPSKNGEYPHCNMEKLRCIADNLKAIKSVDKCGCTLACFNTVYEVEKLNEEVNSLFANSMETEFVSWPVVRYKREVLFGWVDLLVSFGGIAGLFLGFSLLSAVEIIYFFTIRACCMVYRERDELIRIQDDKARRPEVDYDLSLVPYFIRKPFPGQGLDEIAHRNFKSNLKQFHNKIIPVVPYGKNLPPNRILPPLGIEFVN